MGDARDRSSVGGFWSFYRGYTDTSVHTATMAALTAFGLLTFVHRAFVAVAVAAYVLPPIALYLTRDGERTAETPDESRTGDGSDAGQVGDGRAMAEEAATNDAPDDADGDAPAEWTEERTPTDATLRDVTSLASGAVAVGDGGVVLGRGVEGGSEGSDGDGGWNLLVSDGPAAEGRDLTGVAATDDGAAAWLCGANGAAGRYDAETGRHTDRSAPRDITDSWTDVAVTGRVGEETVYLANGSGEVVRGTVRGGDGDEVSWTAPVTPGSGSSVAALDADGAVRACDTSGNAFESTDGGETFARVGVDGASGTFTDLTAGGGHVRLTADDGSVYRDDAGWTRDRPVETRLAGVDADGDAAVAVGDDGTVCRDAGGGWGTVPVPTDASLEGVHVDADECAAVGGAGTVLRVERASAGAEASGDSA